MGTNSNRSRARCKQDGCNELTRSNSGLCRLHMQTPAEAVIIRTERPLRDDYNRWPLRWEGGAVYRDRLGQTATLPAETATPTNDRTATDTASHSASGCGHAGVGEYSRWVAESQADAPVTTRPGRFTASEIATLIGIAAIGVALFLASPLGAGVIAMVK